MAAYDNVAMPGAPAAPSYAAPLLNFGPLGDLGNDYYKGQQQQQQQQVRNAFKDGLPLNPQGQPDYNAMAQKLFQLGDFGDAGNVAMTGMKLSAMQDTGAPTPPVFGQPNSQPQPSMAPALTPAQPSQPTSLPQRPSAPVTSGGDNPNSVMSAVAGQVGDEKAGPIALRIAGALKIDPNAPLTPEQSQQVGALMLRAGLATPTGSPTPPGQTQVAQAVPADQQPAADQQPGVPSPAAALVPPNYRGREGEFSNLLRQQADLFRQQARREGIAGINSKPLEDRAAAYETRAQKIDEALSPTPEQRNALASGAATPLDYERQQKYQEADIKRGAALYTGLQGSSRAFDEMKPHLDAMTSIFADPNFYSGTGAGLNLAYKRALVALGGDANTALPQEAVKKVLAQNILNQVNQLKAEAGSMGQNGGRIFMAQVKLMEDAAQKSDNSPAALRYLTELGYRSGNHANDVATLAQNYKGGHLDAGFDAILQKYNSDHPMFTPAEMKDIRLVAPPSFESPQAAYAAGLKKGDPVRTPPRPGFPRGQVGYLK